MAQFFAEGGLPYDEMLASGYDVQLVHSEIDWRSSLRYGDEGRVEVSVASVGATSFTLWFAVYAEETLVASGRTVYVVVATDGTGKRPLPPSIRGALGAVPGEA
jgi:acyl-CoA thioester hydrolase